MKAGMRLHRAAAWDAAPGSRLWRGGALTDLDAQTAFVAPPPPQPRLRSGWRAALALLSALALAALASPAPVSAAAPAPAEGEAFHRIAHTIRQLSSHGSRIAGYPGDRFAADFVERELRAAGVREVQREPYEIVVPMDHGASLELIDEGGQALERIPLQSLWPNLVRTNTLGPEGRRGHLFYGGAGEHADFNGHAMDGAVVLMEFNTWTNWKNAAALGAQAIIFVEPEETTNFESRTKWSWTPVDVPRFWLGRQAALRLRERLGDGEIAVHLRARMDFERHTTWAIWGRVPGTTPGLAEELVAVHAYYDGLSVVPSEAPAAESACGIAALLELARHLRDHPPARSVVLVATGSHFQGDRGLFQWLNKHARRLPPFRGRMPKRFVADSLKVDKLVRQSDALGIPFDTLGVRLRDTAGGPVLESVDLPRLRAQLKRRRIKPDSLGIRLEPDSLDINLFLALDLSSQSDQVGLVHSARASAHRRFFVALGRSFSRHAADAAADLGREPRGLVNLVSPIKGLSWDSYLDEDVYREDGEIARDVGLVALNLVTTTDRRSALDSPLDRPDRVDFGNVARQSEMINHVLTRALADPGLFGSEWEKLGPAHDKNLPDGRVAIDGRLRLLPRRSATPEDPVPHGAVVLLHDYYPDMWRPWIALADDEGNYAVNGLSRGRMEVHAFLLDEETGEITYATDLGDRAQKIGAWRQGLTKAETVWTTILFETESIEIHDRIHAGFHFTFGNSHRGMKVLDDRGAVPRQYGYVMGDFLERMMVLYGPPEEPLRLVDKSMVLLNNTGAVDELSAQGAGFDLSRRRMIPYATLQSTRDMWRLDEVRMERMREFAIENPRLDALHQRALVAVEKAEEAMAGLDWGRYAKYVREAIGLEYRAYPDVRSTQNDIITGLVFFVALLVPAAFFAERLLFAAPDIRRQIAWFTAIMLVIWAILSQVHPAFELAHPVIVLLALMVMAMAIFVITLVVSRFNAYMAELRQRSAGTASGDLSRSGTAYVAFMLGISNMRRRVLRTGLTLTTITMLTFTVLSFTSFKPAIRFVGFEKDWEPLYRGVLMHDIHWWSWEPPVYDYLHSHFGEAGTVVARTWMTMGFEEEGYIPMRFRGREADALGVLGLTPAEPAVTGIDRSLTAGRWFVDPGESSTILAAPLAEQLGISEEEVERGEGPLVRVFGQGWQVVGIYDPLLFEEVRDLNNEPLTPAKEQFEQFNMPGLDQMFMMNDFFMDADIDVGYEHLSAARLAVMPYARLESLGAELMSVAISFDDEVPSRQLIEEYLTRANFRLFVGLPDEEGEPRTYAYSSIGLTSVEGLGALVIPILIAALIVLNTMMGAVYERFREIGVYSSVGLAPVHIAFLFVAESCVYGVLGVVIGYVLGQVGGKVLLSLGLLGGVSLNYSSTAAIGSALLVIAVVLLSSVYPARTAAQLAVPDVVRRWQLPDPEDDVWRFPFPFTVNVKAVDSLCGYLHSFFCSYGHESVGHMYTERTRIVVEEGERAVQLLLWLAPFDMGVSQYLQFTIAPTGNPSIWEIQLYIERVSGPVAFWQRLNLGFMLEMRKRFLVWQTLKPDIQEEHAVHCREVALPAGELELDPVEEISTRVG